MVWFKVGKIKMKTDKIIRMRLTTYRHIRQVFPGKTDESLAKYFKRLGHYIDYMKVRLK